MTPALGGSTSVGPGAMAPEIARRLGPGRRYVGFDVHEPSIRRCRKSRFFEMVEGSGMRVQWMSAGYFPRAARLTGQDVLLLGL